MGKTKKSDHPPVRQKIFASVEEVHAGIEKLRGRMFQIEELKKDGIPYRDAMRVSAEFQIRESIRDIFGERSTEFQEHQHHRIKSTGKADLAETRALLEHLISQLEDKKQELLGLDSVLEEAPPAPARSSTTKPEPAVPVSPTKAAKPAPPPAAKPVPPAIAQPITVPLTPQAPPPPPPKPAAAAPTPPPPAPAPVMAPPVSSAAVPPSPGPAFSPPHSTPPPQASGTVYQPAVPGPSAPSVPAGLTTPAAGGPSSLEVLRKICTRFHIVARKLRQRREDRPTLEVEDESDVQDVVHALLSMEFDDIRTEEWTPGYVRTSRMDFLLPADGIVLEVKKTRQGFGAKEIASQLWVDFQRYLARPDCKILFCFVYDPEGRIGNPRRLETELTRVSDGKHVEVLISPK